MFLIQPNNIDEVLGGFFKQEIALDEKGLRAIKTVKKQLLAILGRAAYKEMHSEDEENNSNEVLWMMYQHCQALKTAKTADKVQGIMNAVMMQYNGDVKKLRLKHFQKIIKKGEGKKGKNVLPERCMIVMSENAKFIY